MGGIALGLFVCWVALMAKDASIDTARAIRGKEPVTAEKFRKRYARSEQKREQKMGKTAGPARRYVRKMADNAATRSIERSNAKTESYRQWLQRKRDADELHQRDVAKWDRRLARRNQRVQQWGEARGVVRPGEPVDTVGTGEDTGTTDNTEQPPVPRQNLVDRLHQAMQQGDQAQICTRDDLDAASSDEYNELTREAVRLGVRLDVQDHAVRVHIPTPAAQSDSSPQESTDATGGGMHYEQYVQDQHSIVEETRQFAADLIGGADALAGHGYGPGITDALKDASAPITAAADDFASAMEVVQRDGDAMRDAFEQAPDVPDQERV